MENGKRYRVEISRRAAAMLVSHASFLASVSPEAAEQLTEQFTKQFTEQFTKAAESLEYMPERCAWLNGEMLPENRYRKLLFGKRYLMIFTVDSDTVYVAYVVDCRQDYGWLIR